MWLEYPDTNDGKQLSSMCRRLEPLLREALHAAQLLSAEDNLRLPRLHVVFTSKQEAYVATSATRLELRVADGHSAPEDAARCAVAVDV